MDDNVRVALHFLSVFQPVGHLFTVKSSYREEVSWGEEHLKFKASLLSLGRSSIKRILLTTKDVSTFSHLLNVVDSSSLEGMLE